MKKNNLILNIIAIFALFQLMSVVDVWAINTNPAIKGTIDPNSELITDTGILTVNGVVSSDEFNAYKIADAFYNSSTNQIKYEFTSQFSNFLTNFAPSRFRSLTISQYMDGETIDPGEDGVVTSNSALDELASAYANYIRSNTVMGNSFTVTGTEATAEVAVGSYLILPITTLKVYAVMVGNIEYYSEGAGWELDEGFINAKVSEPGTVDKTFEIDGSKSKSFSYGKEYVYNISATLPIYPEFATNKTYVIHDEADEGITFNFNNFEIRNSIGDTINNNYYTLAQTQNGFTVSLNLAEINDTVVTIVVRAQLNANATVGSEGNVNRSYIVYSNDPYGTGTVSTASNPTTATVYTYGLKLFNHEQDNSSVAVPGSVFEIYDSENTKVVEITLDNEGKHDFVGLALGTYTLRQKSAPSGYSVADDVVFSITNANVESNGYISLNVESPVAGALPFTGGTGTYIFIIVGLLLVAFAVSTYNIYRRKKLLLNE